MKSISRIFLLALTITTLISPTLSFGQAFVPPPDRRQPNHLLKIYSDLRIGMKYSEVRNLAEKYYPNCKMEDTDIWEIDTDTMSFGWLLGADTKLVPATRIRVERRVHQITLIMIFDKDLNLVRATYDRYANNRTEEKRIPDNDESKR